MGYIIVGREIYTSNGVLKDTGVLIDNGKIKELGIIKKDGCTIINLDKYRILPGMIDMHIHGANGFDTMDASYEALNEISKHISKSGVTAFVATTVTARLEKIMDAVRNVSECVVKGLDGARLLGSYIEGPYITKEYKGAHPEEYIREIDIDELDYIINESKNTVKVIAIAPEKKSGAEAVKYLTGKGIKVSLGHTNATYDKAVQAAENGATIAVHVYNGMRGLHHREAGMLGAALNCDKINTELICDGIHVEIPAMQIVLRCKRTDNIILISDCIRAGGMNDGEYMLGELKVTVRDGIARVESGSLAGSTLKLSGAVKNMVEKVGADFEDAVKMATINPARVLGIDNVTGSIAVGKKADITAVDDSLNVVFTMVDGKIVYQKNI